MASHHSIIDYFSITVFPIVLYSVLSVCSAPLWNCGVNDAAPRVESVAAASACADF